MMQNVLYKNISGLMADLSELLASDEDPTLTQQAGSLLAQLRQFRESIGPSGVNGEVERGEDPGYSLSLLQATLESSASAIFAVNREGRIAAYNKKFLSLWGLKEEWLQSGQREKCLEHMSSQLRDPGQFFQKVQYLYQNPDAESHDILELLDGRIIERYSRPQLLDGEIIGRFWSFDDITRQKKAEQALSSSEARLQAFMSNLPAIAFIKNEEGQYIYFNKDSSQTDAYIRKSDSEWLSPETARQLQENDQWVRETLRSEEFQEDVRYRDGRHKSFITIKFPLHDTDGKLLVGGIALDISERKLIEEEIIYQKNLLRSVIDSIEDSIIVLDRDGTVSLANRSIKNDLGVDITGKNIDEVVRNYVSGAKHGPGSPEFLPVRALKGEEIIGEELFLGKKTEKGTEPGRYYTVNAKPLRNENGEVIASVSVFRDISGQKAYIDELKKRDTLLEAFAHALQYLIVDGDFSRSAMRSLEHLAKANDSDLAVICEDQLSPAGLKTFSIRYGWAKNSEEMQQYFARHQNMPFSSFDIEHWYNRLSEGNIITGDEAGQMGQAITGNYRSYLVLPIFLRGIFWGHLALASKRHREWSDFETAIFRSFAYCFAEALERQDAQKELHDFNNLLINSKVELEMQAFELAQKNEELVFAREAAEVANQAKSIFLSNISHELRTPLNAILGFAQILQKDMNVPDRQREYIEIMHHSATHLLHMINDVLDISRIESGQLELQEEVIDMHQLLREISQMFMIQCREKNLEICLKIAPDLPSRIISDPKRLRQVIINLTGNAIKFTQHGHVAITVDYSGRTTGRDGTETAVIRFSISDTGRGIPAEEIPFIFEPFRQVKGMYSEGTGLGLAISSRIVELFGSRLQVKSTLKKGSEFWFEIKARVPQQAGALTELPVQSASVHAEGEKLRVLVVDDLEQNFNTMRTALEPRGHVCRWASGGDEAFDTLKEFSPDIVLLDILLDEERGEAILDQFRTIPQLDNVPVIAVTALAFGEKKQELLSRGFDGYIVKPVKENDLVDEIRVKVREFRRRNSSGRQHKASATDIARKIFSLGEQKRHRLAEAIEVQDLDTIITTVQQILGSNGDSRELLNLKEAAIMANFRLLVDISHELSKQEIKY